MNTITELPEELELREPFVRLSRDMKRSARMLKMKKARFLTDTYYQQQDGRIRAGHQKRKQAEDGEPCDLIDWIFSAWKRLESSIQAMLGEFAAEYAVGQWLQAQVGIGPILSAAMICNFDIRRAPTVGHYWSFAGLNPNAVWEKGKKRPWNAKLRSICCEHFGETMVKHQNREGCYYGQMFAAKKAELWEQNLSGKFAEVADREIHGDKKIGKSTEKWHWNSGQIKAADAIEYLKAVVQWRDECAAVKQWNKTCNGQEDKFKVLPDPPEIAKGLDGSGDCMLAPGHIHDRARRWMVKLFLSHLHEVMFWDYYNAAPPAPYIFEHPELGDHRHKLSPPLWPAPQYDGQSLRVLYER